MYLGLRLSGPMFPSCCHLYEDKCLAAEVCVAVLSLAWSGELLQGTRSHILLGGTWHSEAMPCISQYLSMALREAAVSGGSPALGRSCVF